MANQEEVGQVNAVPKKPVKVFVLSAPRDEPKLRSIRSLDAAVNLAGAGGIECSLYEITGAVPGFHNTQGGCRLFIEGDFTHFFLTADDVLFPSTIILKLVGDNKDIVGAAYRKRVLVPLTPANWNPNVEEFSRRMQEKGIYETEYCSGHCLLIKRHVIEKMIKDYPELEYEHPHSQKIEWGLWWPMIENRRVFMDDWAFALRAKRSGFKMYDDYSVVCPHYTGEFLGFGGEGECAYETGNEFK
jgi:hypothetical protein